MGCFSFAFFSDRPRELAPVQMQTCLSTCCALGPQAPSEFSPGSDGQPAVLHAAMFDETEYNILIHSKQEPGTDCSMLLLKELFSGSGQT